MKLSTDTEDSRIDKAPRQFVRVHFWLYQEKFLLLVATTDSYKKKDYIKVNSGIQHVQISQGKDITLEVADAL